MLSTIHRETYRQQIRHCQVMMSRTKILGAATGVTVVVSSGIVRAEEALALIITLVCMMSAFLLTVHTMYQNWIAHINSLSEEGTIDLDEQVRQDLAFPGQDQLRQFQDLAMASIFIVATLILCDQWWPIVDGHEFDSLDDIALVLSLDLIAVSITFVPAFASREGVELSYWRFMMIWLICFLPPAFIANAIDTWIVDYPYFFGFLMAVVAQNVFLILYIKRRSRRRPVVDAADSA